jgi:hypothetical protein
MPKIRDLVEDRFAEAFRSKSGFYRRFPRRADAKLYSKKCRDLVRGFREQARTLVEAGIWDPVPPSKFPRSYTHYEYVRLMFGFDYTALLAQMVRWFRSRPNLSTNESNIRRHIIEPLLTPPGDTAVWPPCFMWQGPEQRKDLIDHIFSSIGEVLDALRLMRGEGAPSALEIGDRTAKIGGKECRLTEKGWEFLKALNLEPGKWITGKELGWGTRWDRVLRRLPVALRRLVETDRQHGYRLKPSI